MRKTLIALAALLSAGVAHADPVSVHGITLGRDLPPSCEYVSQDTPTPCVEQFDRVYGNLRLYTLTGLAEIGGTNQGSDAVTAFAAVGADGKVRAVATVLGDAREDFERAREKLALIYGEPSADGAFFSEWDTADSVIEVYSPSVGSNVVFAFDDADASSALEMFTDLFPNEMQGL